jgi:iron complex outermembrane receptor protein
VSFRGSYGTGFKAPNLSDIAGALSFSGSTSGTYACPFPGSVGCLPGSAQYDLVAGPNSASGSQGLKPEKSTQWTLGVRVEPIPELSLALDYWNVKIKDQVESQGIAEQVAFNNPSQYTSLFVNPYLDPAGFQTIAFEQVPFNGGVANYSGLDWAFAFHRSLDWGRFSAAWTGTYMLTQNYTDGPGMPKLTDLGVYGPNQLVVFRTISNLILTLETGKWTNTLSGHYKSGYLDETYSAGSAVVYTQSASGGLGTPVAFAGLSVPAYTTLDWQTTYAFLKNANIALGIRNLSDKAPPLSLQTGGGGNQIGYDGRYYDPIGRTYYFRVNLKF